MANAASLINKTAVRAIILGRPKTHKTGALAALANAGFKIRMLDYDGNYESLVHNLTPEGLARVDIVSLEDKLRLADGGYIEPVGLPTAFTEGLRLMSEWKYRDPDTGLEVNLGKSSEWGPDTVVVLDSLTKFGDAAYRLAMVKLNKNPKTANRRVWQFATADQQGALRIMASRRFGYHLVIIAHEKAQGPETYGDDDDDMQMDLKKRMAEVVPTRIYPTALGRKLPEVIGGEVSTIIRAQVIEKGGKTIRALSIDPALDTDVAAPVLKDNDGKRLNGPLPADTGLLTIFKALGANPPAQ